MGSQYQWWVFSSFRVLVGGTLVLICTVPTSQIVSSSYSSHTETSIPFHLAPTIKLTFQVIVGGGRQQNNSPYWSNQTHVYSMTNFWTNHSAVALNPFRWMHISNASKPLSPNKSQGLPALISPYLLWSILFPSRISSTQTFCTDPRLRRLHDQLCG